MGIAIHRSRGLRASAIAALAAAALTLLACASPLSLVERGRDLFFRETFGGNGRTCGTCHPAENNFTIDPAFIASLPDDDPLFVAEFVPELSENFENPVLMRKFGLILENLDGFDDLENRFVMRGVPHTLALPGSIDGPGGEPRTGWSGDGAPMDGSLRSFAVGAVIQHFPRTALRRVGVDFRLPTEEELDALEAFQLSLGRREDPALPLPLKGVVARRGQAIFLDDELGKCNRCHRNAGASSLDANTGEFVNANFDTGVENLPDKPADLTDELVPTDDGFGRPLPDGSGGGDGTFNTPPLVESADTGPFFHDNSVETLEAAVAFYSGEAFNASPAGRFLAGGGEFGIRLDATQTVAVAAFLRVLNALDNIESSIGFAEQSLDRRLLGGAEARRLLARALDENEDAIRVLEGGGLHPEAVQHLARAAELTERATRRLFSRRRLTRRAIEAHQQARADLVEGP